MALAAAISYSRIYLGVHYPTDVAAGVLLGLACGWIGAPWAIRQGKRRRPTRPESTKKTREEAPEVEY